MKLEVSRYHMTVVPETEQDRAYLEEVLGMKNNEDQCTAERINAMGLSCWAYLKIRKADG